MSISNYYTTLLFLIKGHSKQLPLHRPEVTLNQIFFLLGFEKCDFRAISHLLVDILAQPIVLTLTVFNTYSIKMFLVVLRILVDAHDTTLIVWGFF